MSGIERFETSQAKKKQAYDDAKIYCARAQAADPNDVTANANVSAAEWVMVSVVARRLWIELLLEL